jgi:hypothetical protein
MLQPKPVVGLAGSRNSITWPTGTPTLRPS